MIGKIQTWILGNELNAKKNGVVWNAIAGMLNAGQSAIILLFMSRKLSMQDVGIFTIAYAVAVLVSTIALFGVRNYQVTDYGLENRFSDYVASRVITMLITIMGLMLYLYYMREQRGYSEYKILIIVEICILKLIDAFDDVFFGLYQKRGRLDVASKIFAFRLMISTVIISVCVYCSGSLSLAIWAGIASSMIIDGVLLPLTYNEMTQEKKVKPDIGHIKDILVGCFPLCVGTSLSTYIGNVPKYMIDDYMSEDIQAVFGFIMMPVFVIMILNKFIYQPTIKTLGDLWNERKISEFMKRVWVQYVIVVVLTIIVMIGGAIAGIPVLSLLYDVNLSAYKMEFLVLLLGGGLYALAYFIIVPITIIRFQRSIAIGYIITAVLALFLGKCFVMSFGMMGAALLYLLINLIQVIFFTGAMLLGIKER